MSKRARSESLDSHLLIAIEKKRRIDGRRLFPAPFDDLPIEVRFKIWGLLQPEPSDLHALVLTCFAFHNDAYLLFELPPRFRESYAGYSGGEKLVLGLWRLGIVHWFGLEFLPECAGPKNQRVYFNMEYPQGYLKKELQDTGKMRNAHYGCWIEFWYSRGVYTITGAFCFPIIENDETCLGFVGKMILLPGQSLCDFLRTPHTLPEMEEKRQHLGTILGYLKSVGEKYALK